MALNETEANLILFLRLYLILYLRLYSQIIFHLKKIKFNLRIDYCPFKKTDNRLSSNWKTILEQTKNNKKKIKPLIDRDNDWENALYSVLKHVCDLDKETVPKCYVDLIHEVTKHTPVVGLIESYSGLFFCQYHSQLKFECYKTCCRKICQNQRFFQWRPESRKLSISFFVFEQKELCKDDEEICNKDYPKAPRKAPGLAHIF